MGVLHMRNFWAAAPICAMIFTSSLRMNEGLMDQYGQGKTELIQVEKTYSLVTWNIYKNKQYGALEDLAKLITENDFVLLQEFLLDASQKSLIDATLDHQWSFAKSFADAGQWTGVATVSKHQAVEAFALKSPKTEPVTNTPKMSMIAKYGLQNGEVLMVANLHGLNFDLSNASFKSQIDAVMIELRQHVGPLIFAGDFNTWNKERRAYLFKNVQEIQLERVPIENPIGIFKQTLDHIFVRGVKLIDGILLDEIESSDHAPLKIEFTLQ